MKVIYIAGPYRAGDLQGILNNIKRARRVAARLWGQGWAVICPHSNTALFDGLANDSVWLKGDLEILSRCDAVYMMDGWELSEGASQEHTLATMLNKEIIYEGNVV